MNQNVHIPQEEKPESCSCYWESFVRLLARHPGLREAFARLCGAKSADRIVSGVARILVGRYNHRTLDYHQLLDKHACAAHLESGPWAEIDCEFSATLMGNPEGRRRLARFLQSLEDLNPRVRSGLYRTWLHAGVLGAMVREARFAGDRSGGVHHHYPLDAIISAFGQCNLHCQGCYALSEHGRPSASLANLDYIIRQIKRLRVYHVLLVGSGEPFYDEQSKQVLIETARRHPQMFISVYSNGTNIQDRDLRQLRRVANLIPLLSLDGPEALNDRRRGLGVYAKVTDAFRRMKQHGLLFGYISTVFNENCSAVVDPEFVAKMASMGCKMGYYSLFLTTDVNFRDMMLTPAQRARHFQRVRELNASAPIPLLDLDALESHFGCRSKRGATVYIDAMTGTVSPCVRASRAPESCNIYQPVHARRLAEILESDYFERYRQNCREPHTCEAFQRAESACWGDSVIAVNS
jgi:sulfatase maturation enzyme AslB (radical SAM superfamily)